MKSQERHKLKENEFARTVVHAREVLATRQRDVRGRSPSSSRCWRSLAAMRGGGSRPPAAVPTSSRARWRFTRRLWCPSPHPRRGAPLLCSSRVPIVLSRPSSTWRFPSSSRPPTATHRLRPASPPGITPPGFSRRSGASARRNSDFRKSCRRPDSSLYGRTGRLGLAQAQVAQKKYDTAITLYTELSRDTSSQLPVDGVLMQLGRACALAGRKEEAVRAFTRVTEEFPASLYLMDAKRELEETRKS